MNILKAFALLIVLAAPMDAQGFDAHGFFGESFKGDSGAPDTGKLRTSLEGPLDWIELTGSGNGRARNRFNFADTGLIITPDTEHGTCEALLDLGLAAGTGSVTISELDLGGSFAWHLRDIDDSSRSWLIELKHEGEGGFLLRIRSRSGGRYVVLDGTATTGEVELPAELEFSISKGALTGKIGALSTRTAFDPKGLTLGMAVTDARARLRDLQLDITFHPAWMEDATARLEARRILERLREYATTGLLAGMAAYPHPQLEEALKTYTAEQRRERELAQDAPGRAISLEKIADAHPRSAAALHEAGVALLLAGQPAAAHARLLASAELLRTPVNGLALAEASRRIGDLKAVDAILPEVRKQLPPALEPDYALVSGRLLADRGDVNGAWQVLSAAAEKYADRPELLVFAESARTLFEPQNLHAHAAGPFGLKLISDLDESELQPLLDRLKPYIERIKAWLPGLPQKFEGVLAVFNSPIDYLNAALLVAGENVDNVAGMYLTHGIGGGPTVMACRAFGEDELLRTLVHELWHMALGVAGRTESVPRWLNEGMAVFLSAGVMDGEAMRYAELPSEFFAFRDEPLTLFTSGTLKTALAAQPAEFYVPGSVQQNYLAGWATVWFYARGTDAELLRRLLNGDAAAFRRVNADVEKLHAAVTAALEEGIK